jgi:hypothetical protein
MVGVKLLGQDTEACGREPSEREKHRAEATEGGIMVG